MKWDELRQIDGDENIRFCSNCSKNVYLTLSDLSYNENAKWGNCVSIPKGTKLKIKGKDVYTDMPLTGGISAPSRFGD